MQGCGALVGIVLLIGIAVQVWEWINRNPGPTILIAIALVGLGVMYAILKQPKAQVAPRTGGARPSTTPAPPSGRPRTSTTPGAANAASAVRVVSPPPMATPSVPRSAFQPAAVMNERIAPVIAVARDSLLNNPAWAAEQLRHVAGPAEPAYAADLEEARALRFGALLACGANQKAFESLGGTPIGPVRPLSLVAIATAIVRQPFTDGDLVKYLVPAVGCGRSRCGHDAVTELTLCALNVEPDAGRRLALAAGASAARPDSVGLNDAVRTHLEPCVSEARQTLAAAPQRTADLLEPIGTPGAAGVSAVLADAFAIRYAALLVWGSATATSASPGPGTMALVTPATLAAIALAILQLGDDSARREVKPLVPPGGCGEPTCHHRADEDLVLAAIRLEPDVGKRGRILAEAMTVRPGSLPIANAYHASILATMSQARGTLTTDPRTSASVLSAAAGAVSDPRGNGADARALRFTSVIVGESGEAAAYWLGQRPLDAVSPYLLMEIAILLLARRDDDDIGVAHLIPAGGCGRAGCGHLPAVELALAAIRGVVDPGQRADAARRAQQTRPELVPLRHALALAIAGMGQTDEAIGALADVNDERTPLIRGAILFRAGRYDEAAAMLPADHALRSVAMLGDASATRSPSPNEAAPDGDPVMAALAAETRQKWLVAGDCWERAGRPMEAWQVRLLAGIGGEPPSAPDPSWEARRYALTGTGQRPSDEAATDPALRDLRTVGDARVALLELASGTIPDRDRVATDRFGVRAIAGLAGLLRADPITTLGRLAPPMAYEPLLRWAVVAYATFGSRPVSDPGRIHAVLTDRLPARAEDAAGDDRPTQRAALATAIRTGKSVVAGPMGTLSPAEQLLAIAVTCSDEGESAPLGEQVAAAIAPIGLWERAHELTRELLVVCAAATARQGLEPAVRERARELAGALLAMLVGRGEATMDIAVEAARAVDRSVDDLNPSPRSLSAEACLRSDSGDSQSGPSGQRPGGLTAPRAAFAEPPPSGGPALAMLSGGRKAPKGSSGPMIRRYGPFARAILLMDAGEATVAFDEAESIAASGSGLTMPVEILGPLATRQAADGDLRGAVKTLIRAGDLATPWLSPVVTAIEGLPDAACSEKIELLTLLRKKWAKDASIGRVLAASLAVRRSQRGSDLASLEADVADMELAVEVDDGNRRWRDLLADSYLLRANALISRNVVRALADLQQAVATSVTTPTIREHGITIALAIAAKAAEVNDTVGARAAVRCARQIDPRDPRTRRAAMTLGI